MTLLAGKAYRILQPRVAIIGTASSGVYDANFHNFVNSCGTSVLGYVFRSLY
jgi:hypothetical protein